MRGAPFWSAENHAAFACASEIKTNQLETQSGQMNKRLNFLPIVVLLLFKFDHFGINHPAFFFGCGNQLDLRNWLNRRYRSHFVGMSDLLRVLHPPAA